MGQRQPGGTLAGRQVAPHVVTVKRMAGIAHHTLFLAEGTQLAVLVDAEALRRFAGRQPVGHRRRRVALAARQAHRQAVDAVAQGFEQQLGASRGRRIHHQPAALRVDPGVEPGAAHEGARQQFVPHRLAQILHLLAPRFVALFGGNIGRPIVGDLTHHRHRQQSLFDPQADQPLATDRMHHCALGQWRHPALHLRFLAAAGAQCMLAKR